MVFSAAVWVIPPPFTGCSEMTTTVSLVVSVSIVAICIGAFVFGIIVLMFAGVTPL